jgi:uncharacterized protein
MMEKSPPDFVQEAVFGKPPKARPRYKSFHVQSLYLPMRDRVKIAIDLILPGDVPANTKFPTILIMARYWRSFALRGGLSASQRMPIGPRDPLPEFLASNGYAVVVVDSRGSGASFGSTPHPFNQEEMRDYGEVVDWIINQPWSDGSVGATGISYEGTTAQLLPAAHPAATKVVIPQEIELDLYTDTMFPGGIPCAAFVQKWQHISACLDRDQVPPEWGLLARLQIRGVRPVDEDKDLKMLRQAVAEHSANADIYARFLGITYRDDPFDPSGVTIDDFSVSRYRQQIEDSGAALFLWGSWLDGNTADAVLRRYATYRNPQWAAIGAWDHRFHNHGSPYCAPGECLRPDLKQLWQENLEFFDYHLKGKGSREYSQKKLFYFTMGEETWKETQEWPPAGVTMQRWYFAADNHLSPQSPHEESGADEYRVDFRATTGVTNRWHTPDGRTKVIYRDRDDADYHLLTYTSPPLETDIEISGYPVVTLYVTSTHSDGAFYVYLEEVDAYGRVTYITEGLLRAIHRRISDDEPSHKLFVPHHSYRRQDAQPLVPGEIAQLKFGVLPTSVLIRKGHYLRVSIAGHDKDSFTRIPAEGDPTITVQRNSRCPSAIDLPVIPR